jgi:hypothetical protein
MMDATKKLALIILNTGFLGVEMPQEVADLAKQVQAELRADPDVLALNEEAFKVWQLADGIRFNPEYGFAPGAREQMNSPLAAVARAVVLSAMAQEALTVDPVVKQVPLPDNVVSINRKK